MFDGKFLRPNYIIYLVFKLFLCSLFVEPLEGFDSIVIEVFQLFIQIFSWAYSICPMISKGISLRSCHNLVLYRAWN